MLCVGFHSPNDLCVVLSNIIVWNCLSNINSVCVSYPTQPYVLLYLFNCTHKFSSMSDKIKTLIFLMQLHIDISENIWVSHCHFAYEKWKIPTLIRCGEFRVSFCCVKFFPYSLSVATHLNFLMKAPTD